MRHWHSNLGSCRRRVQDLDLTVGSCQHASVQICWHGTPCWGGRRGHPVFCHFSSQTRSLVVVVKHIISQLRQPAWILSPPLFLSCAAVLSALLLILPQGKSPGCTKSPVFPFSFFASRDSAGLQHPSLAPGRKKLRLFVIATSHLERRLRACSVQRDVVGRTPGG